MTRLFERWGVYLASLALHGGIGLALVLVPARPAPPPLIVTVLPPPPKPAAPPPPPAPAPEPAAPPAAPRPAAPAAPRPRAPAPARAAPAAPSAPAPSAAPAAAAAPDFGLTLGGATGGGGVPVPAGGGGGPGRPGGGGSAPAADADGCTEPPAKAKALEVPEPVYPEAAREAGVEGKVRIEIQLDASGVVKQARVVQSLRPDLDEAALEAAKRAQFAPALRCGRASASTFVMSIRFTL